MERKKRLRSLLPDESPHLLHVDFIPEKGKELFALPCERDLEGVVGKWTQGIYQSDGSHVVGEGQEPDLHPGGGPGRAFRREVADAETEAAGVEVEAMADPRERTVLLRGK